MTMAFRIGQMVEIELDSRRQAVEVVTIFGPPERLVIGVKCGDGQVHHISVDAIRDDGHRAPAAPINVERGIALAAAVMAGREAHTGVQAVVLELAGTVLALAAERERAREAANGDHR